MTPRRSATTLALAALAGLLLAAATAGAAPPRERPKVLCIGFDGMDPQLLDHFRADGSMPNFDALIARGDYRNLGTAIPPQSPVAWSNFITGMDPGGHGIFDFIHRNPATLTPYLSAAQAMEPQRWWKVGPWKFPRDEGHVENLRDGVAFWQLLDRAGVEATVFKVPANFPPVECEAHTLSGMGTPDILGTYGIYSYFTEDLAEEVELSGGRHVPVAVRDGRVWGELVGPVNSYRAGDPEARLPFEAVVDREHGSALFDVDGERFLLEQGEWSDWVTLRFRLVPALKSVRGVCRFYLKEVSPTFKLYVTPVNLDPAAPEMPISTPADWSRELAAALGPFYTQGLPDDTKALEEGAFDDDDYVSQSTLVFEEREQQLRHELDRFAAQKDGFLFFYFNSPDQTCHTFWRNMDHESPRHDTEAERHEQRIRDVYRNCDRALGLALEHVDDETLVLVLSDHGFAPYHRSFHVNRWLLDRGYLALQPGVEARDVTYLSGIDWNRTRAYAIGINGLYLNLRGREEGGIVDPGAEREALLQELVAALESTTDPVTGQLAVKYAYRTDEVYHGPHAAEAPDIVLGYHRGFRGSNESALGEVPDATFADNMMKWSGDHCMAADEVPGIIISSRRIDKTDPSLLDLAPTFLSLFGIAPLPEMVGSPLFAGGR
ncbi:MAG: alkaline phosphatase family protein [bacterium]|nr:alkaline phosphatase family protein [bacterium]